jgi:hypothetical protein
MFGALGCARMTLIKYMRLNLLLREDEKEKRNSRGRRR